MRLKCLWRILCILLSVIVKSPFKLMRMEDWQWLGNWERGYSPKCCKRSLGYGVLQSCTPPVITPGVQPAAKHVTAEEGVLQLLPLTCFQTSQRSQPETPYRQCGDSKQRGGSSAVCLGTAGEEAGLFPRSQMQSRPLGGFGVKKPAPRLVLEDSVKPKVQDEHPLYHW